MLTQTEMDMIVKMLHRANSEQLVTVWGRVIAEQEQRAFMIPDYMRIVNVDPSSCDVASGSVKTLSFEGERSD